MYYRRYLLDNFKLGKPLHICPFCHQTTIKLDDDSLTCNNQSCNMGTINIIQLNRKLNNIPKTNMASNIEAYTKLTKDFGINYIEYMPKQYRITIQQGFQLQFLLQLYRMINELTLKAMCARMGMHDVKQFRKIINKPPSTELDGVGRNRWLSFYTLVLYAHSDIINLAKSYLKFPENVVNARIKRFDIDMKHIDNMYQFPE